MSLTDLGPDLATAAAGLDPDTIELRRAIHQEPEVGLQLPMTQAKIAEALTGLGLRVTLGESTTSVVAELDTGRPGPTVLLRADMDALPMQEDYPSDFQSRHDGRMHSCGHDSHVSMLVSAARLLADSKASLNGRVRFMFQPGEEGYHGARYMIEEGVLEGVDRAFAIHVTTNQRAGLVATKSGALMASADTFAITIQGNGGHASAPHHTNDPIPAMAQTISGIHTMVGRSIEATRSGLVSVTHVESGTTSNIIPADAWMEGTIRAHDEKTRATLAEHIQRVAEGTAAAYGCTCKCEITKGYPVTINDADQTCLCGNVATSVLGEENFAVMPRAVMGAEDFSYVLQHVPGVMAFLGVCPEDQDPTTADPLHSPVMHINETALSNGVALYAGMALAGSADG